jgi:hypothetical protein
MRPRDYQDTEGPSPTVPGDDRDTVQDPESPPPAAEPPAASAAPRGPLARIEVLERDGRVRQALAVTAWPVSIGRAIDNDVVLDDPHVAPHHAVLEADAEGRPRLRVLPGRNGMLWGRRRLPAGGEPVLLVEPAAGAARRAAAGVPAPRGAIELTAGLTRLRLRRAGDALEPEREIATAGRQQAGTLALALLLWLWLLAEHWIGLDPGSKASDWLPPLVGAPLALAGWCLAWALASKIFQHRFEFWPHVGVAVRGLLAVEVTNFVLLWLSGLSGWPVFAQLVTGATAAVGVATLWAHARLVLPQQRRALAWAAATAYVAGAAILLALNQQRHERWFSELYAHMLPPPALMWQAPTARSTFVKRAERLRPALERSSAEAAAEQKEVGDDSEDE